MSALRYDISAAGDWSIWLRPAEGPYCVGHHVISGCGTKEAALALAALLTQAAALRDAGHPDLSAVRIAGQVAKAMGGSIAFESFAG